MSTGFELFAERARAGGMVPVIRQVVLDGDTPVTAFAKLHRGPYGFLLESLEGGERWARYTFLATDPRQVYRYRDRECSRWSRGHGVEGGRDRHRAAGPSGPHHAAAPAGRGGRAAPVHRRRGGLPGLRRRPHHRVAPPCAAGRSGSPGCDPDGYRHAAGARQPLQPRHGHRDRGSARGCRQQGAAPAVRPGRDQDRVLAGTTRNTDDRHAARDRAAPAAAATFGTLS